MLNVAGVHLYYGASHALRGVDVQAEKGKVTCVLGRNGVGKSSLLKAIMGLESVARGQISWAEKDITKMPTHRRAALGIGYVPQGREIFPLLTVEENLRSGFAALPRAKRSIPEDIFALFPVLKDMMHRRGGDLSGGQQQQLAIGRALVTRPSLLILDEPTEGIQPSIIKQIEEIIRMLANRGDMAMVLVEQYFEFARDLADSFAVLDRGEVVLSGDRAALLAQEDEVRRHLTV